MKLDNFALEQLQTCPAKYQLRIRDGWTSKRKSGALGAGAALHSGLAVWYTTGSLTKALEAIDANWPTNQVPIDDWRTKDKVMRTMIEYTQQYPHEDFEIVGMKENSPLVEQTFTFHLAWMPCSCGWGENAHPSVLLEHDHPHCPTCYMPLEPLEYGGILDTAVMAYGQVYILEHKTTSRMEAYYFNQFKPNNQVTGYIWAAGHMTGGKCAGAIINAIAWYKSQKTKFERKITTRSPADIRVWEQNVVAEALLIRHYERVGIWPMRSKACTIYGQCEYHDVHLLANPEDQQRRLATDFVQDRWEFENRDT